MEAVARHASEALEQSAEVQAVILASRGQGSPNLVSQEMLKRRSEYGEAMKNLIYLSFKRMFNSKLYAR